MSYLLIILNIVFVVVLYKTRSLSHETLIYADMSVPCRQTKIWVLIYNWSKNLNLVNFVKRHYYLDLSAGLTERNPWSWLIIS